MQDSWCPLLVHSIPPALFLTLNTEDTDEVKREAKLAARRQDQEGKKKKKEAKCKRKHKGEWGEP